MNNAMSISSAQYIASEEKNTAVKIIIDGQKLFVPIDPANRHYAEILRQVDAGTLTIAAAD
tara:strand:- start:4 stop:186 length:183 start_codon:yes stop_codon:yes gene_type:complete